MRKNNRLYDDLDNEHVDSDGSWAISYGDMITLLLSFFVLYFTVDFDAQKEEQLTGALFTSLKELNETSKRQIASENKYNDPKFTEKEEKDLKKWNAIFHKVGNNIVVEFDNLSFFDLGEIVPRKDASDVLRRFSKIYAPYAGKYLLSIKAFTDSKKVNLTSTRFKDNLELSALRSVAAMRVFQHSGIPLNRMQLGGQGVNRILISSLKRSNNNTKDKEALSRKVMLVIRPDREEET